MTAKDEMTYEEAIEILKREFAVKKLHFTLGPEATPEKLLAEGRKVMNNIIAGNYEIVDDFG